MQGLVMKLNPIGHAPRLPRRARGASTHLKPRSSYPQLARITLRSGPLQRLAWIFGFSL
jgi:hypothetical protein